MKYFLLSPKRKFLYVFETTDIRESKAKIRIKYTFGTHFAVASQAEIAYLKHINTLPANFDLSTTKIIKL